MKAPAREWRSNQSRRAWGRTRRRTKGPWRSRRGSFERSCTSRRRSSTWREFLRLLVGKLERNFVVSYSAGNFRHLRAIAAWVADAGDPVSAFWAADPGDAPVAAFTPVSAPTAATAAIGAFESKLSVKRFIKSACNELTNSRSSNRYREWNRKWKRNQNDRSVSLIWKAQWVLSSWVREKWITLVFGNLQRLISANIWWGLPRMYSQ